MSIAQILLSLLLVLTSIQFRSGRASKNYMKSHEIICLNPFEDALYKELNDYRATHNLPAVSLSPSLTYVAQVHCRDLQDNYPHQRENCNMHSWSRSGKWTHCCYTPDHKRSECMWNKPRELTSYNGDGFEIAFYSTARYSDADSFAKDAISNWSISKGHNDVMLNRGIWKNVTWKAVGVGHYGEYATIWFGKEVDRDTIIPKRCE